MGTYTVDCPCCGQVTIEDCDDFAECFEIVAGVSGRQAIVTITGIADDSCTDCEDFNDEFTFTSLEELAPCFLFDNTASVSSCLYNGLPVSVAVRFGFATSQWWVLVSLRGVGDYGYKDNTGIALGKISELCSGGELTLPLQAAAVGAVCDDSSAVIKVRLD